MALISMLSMDPGPVGLPETWTVAHEAGKAWVVLSGSLIMGSWVAPRVQPGTLRSPVSTACETKPPRRLRQVDMVSYSRGPGHCREDIGVVVSGCRAGSFRG